MLMVVAWTTPSSTSRLTLRAGSAVAKRRSPDHAVADGRPGGAAGRGGAPADGERDPEPRSRGAGRERDPRREVIVHWDPDGLVDERSCPTPRSLKTDPLLLEGLDGDDDEDELDVEDEADTLTPALAQAIEGAAADVDEVADAEVEDVDEVDEADLVDDEEGPAGDPWRGRDRGDLARGGRGGR